MSATIPQVYIAFKVELQRRGSDPCFHRFRGIYHYADLCTVISQLWGERPNTLVLEYTDDEGDRIRFSTDVEWAECAKIHLDSGAPLLRLTGKRMKDLKKNVTRQRSTVDAEASSSESEVEINEDLQQLLNNRKETHKEEGAPPPCALSTTAATEEWENLMPHAEVRPSASQERQEPGPRDDDEDVHQHHGDDPVPNPTGVEANLSIEPPLAPPLPTAAPASVPPLPAPARFPTTRNHGPAGVVNTNEALQLVSMFPDMTLEEANAALYSADFDIRRAIEKKLGVHVSPVCQNHGSRQTLPEPNNKADRYAANLKYWAPVQPANRSRK